jgi:hypothetical protein
MVYLGEIKLAEESEKIWDEYQYRNRELKDRADRFDDAERARLNSAPTHVMKIATIFELARAAKQNVSGWPPGSSLLRSDGTL